MKASRLIFITIIIFIACTSPRIPVFAETCNRIVAFVNKDIVTLHELNRKIAEITGIDPEDLQSRDRKAYIETRRQALDLLIDQKITEKKIKELGIEANQQQIDAAIENIKKENSLTNEDLIASLENQGLTLEALQENIKNDIERMQLINLEVKSKIIINDEQIRQYYTENEKDFKIGGQVHLASIILIRKNPSDQQETNSLYNKISEILLRARNGEDFGRLAGEFSEGTGKEEGGDLGFFKTAQLDPQLADIIEKMDIGDISEPVIRPFAIQIVKLLDKQEKTVKPLDEVRGNIYEILYRKEINNRYLSWIRELREKSYTKIVF
ncbi:MAG: peptidylprolyl isomerase [Deltaproteobacteria bacterium]|nr:peptidylprolyl isomerase [Deltaproteobacteria bacterium]